MTIRRRMARGKLVCTAGTLLVWMQMTAGAAAQTAEGAAGAQTATTQPPTTQPATTQPTTTRTATMQPAAAVPAADAPITGRQRTRWALESSLGPTSLAAGVISAGWGVARDSPDEYGSNLRGFGKRYALRLSGVTIGNSIEAGLGAAWGEDPRYLRIGAGPFMSRVGRAGKWTVLARRPDGSLAPAYARAAGIVGNNFITNAWRVDSDSSTADALSRSSVGVVSRFVGNLFLEFWPDVQRKVFRRDP